MRVIFKIGENYGIYESNKFHVNYQNSLVKLNKTIQLFEAAYYQSISVFNLLNTKSINSLNNHTKNKHSYLI